MLLESATGASGDGPQIDTLLTVKFGIDGTGRDYQLDGWSITENTFTWTNAETSRIQLPPFPVDGRCILRLVGNPLISRDQVPLQRIEVLVNGEFLGAAHIRDISVIECEVPRRLLQEREAINVALHLPTAARPKQLTGIDDDRLLAFALHQVIVLRVRPAINAD